MDQPFTATQIATQIGEIIRIILEFLEADSPSEYRNSSLLNAALACKAFEEPALDFLWRTMDSFLPLLRLIPGFKYLHNDMVRFDSFPVPTVLRV